MGLLEVQGGGEEGCSRAWGCSRSREVALESCSVKSSRFCWRGVLISSVLLIRPMAVEDPEETLVPEKIMFFLSWLTVLGSDTRLQCLMMETNSPVRINWSILRVVE